MQANSFENGSILILHVNFRLKIKMKGAWCLNFFFHICRAFPFIILYPLIRSEQSHFTGKEIGAYIEMLSQLSKFSQLIWGTGVSRPSVLNSHCRN